MKLLNGNTLYEFTVAQSGGDTPLSTDSEDFQIEFRYRNFQSRLQSQRSIGFTRNGSSSSSSSSSFMADVLQEFDVPETTRSDMAAHFNFYVDRLSRRICNRRGSISSIFISVCLDAKELSPERAAAIQSRIESGRRESERERDVRRVAVEREVAPLLPADKSVVEGLERRVTVFGEERECSICLEKIGEGVEVIRLPCAHIYHTDCITQWLQRTHFCPFCRFKL
ncbi:hypothetical protein SOVF_027410 [Spinacia oleracea]|uniref:RING-type E3 ubiquitin transferase n=1 Tax=Spinacia oleracea TaxID=3562 RepID=A0A9R0JJK7_SPIOL|nr:E3 ubiquitin-protein ligase At3g02290-like [Spinacia oleracea]KNA23143.1 hypothetical protein SOVF_027410 [Spinacia oleracea]